jgi:hypothetical protein
MCGVVEECVDLFRYLIYRYFASRGEYFLQDEFRTKIRLGLFLAKFWKHGAKNTMPTTFLYLTV